MPMDLQLLIDTQSMVYYCLYSGCLWEVGLSVITHPSLCPWRFPHQFPGVPCLHWAQAAVLSFWWPTSAERIHGFFDAQLLPSDCQGGVLQLDGRRKIQPMWAYPMMNIVKPSPRIFHALFKCFLLINQPQLEVYWVYCIGLAAFGKSQFKTIELTRYTTVDEVQYHEDCTLRGAPGTEARHNSGDQGGSGPGATKVEHVFGGFLKLGLPGTPT